MYSNSYMPSSLINGYKRPLIGWPHSVYFLLSFNMKVLLLCFSFFVIVLSEEKPYYIPSDYYDLWTVIGRNSSGQLYFNPTSDSRRVFIWKPNNGSVPPSLFFENHPKILQNNLPTTSSGIFEETVSPDIHSTSSSTPEKIEETLSTARSPVQPSVNTPTTSALELPPKRKPKNATTGQPGTNFLQLHETLRRAKLASKLNRQPSAHNLTLPQPEMVLMNSLRLAQTRLSTLKTKLALPKRVLVFLTFGRRNDESSGKSLLMLQPNSTSTTPS